MKVSESINLIKQVKPNGYGDEVLLSFINELESMVWMEAFKRRPEDFTSYTLPEHADETLLMVKPYDACYQYYVSAKIDFQNEESVGYRNNMEMFNSLYLEYKKYMNRTSGTGNVLKVHKYW